MGVAIVGSGCGCRSVSTSAGSGIEVSLTAVAATVAVQDCRPVTLNHDVIPAGRTSLRFVTARQMR